MKNTLIILFILIFNITFAQYHTKPTQIENNTFKIEKFHENGTIFEVGYYKDGLKIGEWIQYDKVGNIKYKAYFEKGNIDHVLVYKNQKIVLEILYTNGKQEKVITYIR